MSNETFEFDEPEEVDWSDDDETLEGDTSGEEIEFREGKLDSDRLDAIEDAKEADERVTNALAISKDNYTLSPAVVNISDIVIPVPVKDSRKETYLGMTTSVDELGVLNPIHVMVLEGYSDYLEEGGKPEEYEGPKYALIDGLRRVFSAKKNGLERLNAMVWNFKDKEKGANALILISLVLNKHQRKSWQEIWYMYQILEESSSLTPGEIEYLLSLEAGDATKLKEVMTRADEFPEPRDDLIAKKKTLQQAFNALNKAMKEQNALVKEDLSGVSGMNQVEGIVDGTGNDTKLSDEEVRKLLEMEDSFDGNVSDEDFDEFMGNNLPDDRQQVGDRHPLDPALRAAVLQRDGYCCQVTGHGKGLPAPIALGILNVHHKVPVHCGGTDTMDNLITVDLSVHTLIHLIERNNGKLGMTKEAFDALEEEEKKFVTGAMRIARIAVEANRRIGRSKEQIYRDTSDSIRFKMPGVVQRENMEALAQAKAGETG